jgi:hypothetical protein
LIICEDFFARGFFGAKDGGRATIVNDVLMNIVSIVMPGLVPGIHVFAA